MATPRKPLCADLSRENAEPLAATASRIDYWLLIEYRGLWSRTPLAGSGLSDEIKSHIRAQLSGRGSSRLLFVKRPERRSRAGVAVFHGATREGETKFFRRELGSYDDVLGVDLAEGGEPLGHPLFVVCTHGKRDRCCAIYGRPVYEALRDELDPDWVWQSTHVGGDRFAGNLVVLPEGLYFGRAEGAGAARVVDAYLAGRIDLEHYRGRCWYPFPVQAAEQAVREELDLRGFDDLSLAAVARERDGWKVVLRAADGRLHERLVIEELGELTYLTCDAERLQRPRRFRALR